MAELILKTSTNGPDPAYQDGDIIHAMNDLRIYDVHAQHICHKDEIGFNGDGLRPANSLTEMYLTKCRQYKFERISITEIKRITLATMDEEILSDKLNADGEQMNVALYIRRRKEHGKHLIFGTAGSEVWYGGRTSQTTAISDDIWNEIESRTAYLKTNYNRWPFTGNEKRQHLILAVDDFDNVTRGSLEESEYDRDGGIVKRRKNKVDWHSIGLSAAEIDDVLDPDKEVDIRESRTFDRATIIEAKPTAIEIG